MGQLCALAEVSGTANQETEIMDNPVSVGASHIPLITICSSNKHIEISFLFSNVLFNDEGNW
jgi:hypothetical protein